MLTSFFPCNTNKLVLAVVQYKAINYDFFQLVFIVLSDTSEATVSRYIPFIKICVWTWIKSSCGSLVDTPDQKSQLLTLINNCRLSKLRIICRANLSELRETHNFTIPSSIGLKTYHVSLTTRNSWNRFKVRIVSSKMPRVNRYPKHHSIYMNNILYNDISPLHYTKVSILKIISSIFI